MPSRFVAASNAQIQAVINPILERHLAAYGREVARITKKAAPRGYAGKGRSPGELKRGVRLVTDFGPASLRLFVGVDESVEHAMTIHQGHKTIRVKKSKYMKFKTRDGEFHSLKKVRPVAGYPFLFHALNEANAKFPEGKFRIVIKKQPRGGLGPGQGDARGKQLPPLNW